jgi:hypothetical protein
LSLIGGRRRGWVRPGEKRCGTAGIAGCLLHPRKIITTGEGGAVATRQRRRVALSAARNHGALRAPQPAALCGFNFRISDVNAALGLARSAPGPVDRARRRRGDLRQRPETSRRAPAGAAGAGASRHQSYVIVLAEGHDRGGCVRAGRAWHQSGPGARALHCATTGNATATPPASDGRSVAGSTWRCRCIRRCPGRRSFRRGCLAEVASWRGRDRNAMGPKGRGSSSREAEASSAATSAAPGSGQRDHRLHSASATRFATRLGEHPHLRCVQGASRQGEARRARGAEMSSTSLRSRCPNY